MQVLKSDDPLSFEGARMMEQQGEYKKAATAYEQLLKQSSKKIKILERLLVVYRKLNDPAKELRSIDAAIRIHQQQYPVKITSDKKIATLSKQLNKILGHSDKRGKNMLVPPEISKLELRKTRLLKKQNVVQGKK
jgi:tetratricopeptide (TPR) repeat protein